MAAGQWAAGTVTVMALHMGRGFLQYILFNFMLKWGFYRWVQFVLLILLVPGLFASAQGQTFRPPSVPLVACDPYFSIWSPADKLTDADTTHWTGKPQRLTSLVRIDGKSFRFMGAEPAECAGTAADESCKSCPPATIYTFDGAGRSPDADFHDCRFAG